MERVRLILNDQFTNNQLYLTIKRKMCKDSGRSNIANETRIGPESGASAHSQNRQPDHNRPQRRSHNPDDDAADLRRPRRRKLWNQIQFCLTSRFILSIHKIDSFFC